MSKVMKVKDIIESNDWRWPLVNSPDLGEVKAMMVEKMKGGKDVIW